MNTVNKYICCTIAFILLAATRSDSQSNAICYVRYNYIHDQEYGYNQWFNKDFVIYSPDHVTSKLLNDFPVEDNGKFFHTSDTVKYKSQYHDFLNQLRDAEKKLKQPLFKREYTSDIQHAVHIIGGEKYLVIDTLTPMNNWELMSDTLNILGFTCQKAMIVYKERQYIAYFTTQLPYTAGPLYNRGLPGLILKVFDINETVGFIATEIQFPYTGKIPVWETDAKVISKKEELRLAGENNKFQMELFNKMLQFQPKKQD